MVNDLYTSIAVKLESLFDEPRIYFDKLPQGYKAPSFFIKLLSATHELKLYNRYELTLNFDVHYLPNDRHIDVEEFNDVAYRLLFGLEYIEFNNSPIRGMNISYEVQEDVLHFFITYKLFIRRSGESIPLMEKLYQKYGLKEK